MSDLNTYLYVLIPAGAVGLVYLVRKLRELQWGWVRSTESLKDKIFIVTGANTGGLGVVIPSNTT